MSIFGSQRDFALIRKMNREVLREIVEQEAAYYKISLEDTQANIYGESLTKTFLPPVLLNCLVTRGDQGAARRGRIGRHRHGDLVLHVLHLILLKPKYFGWILSG